MKEGDWIVMKYGSDNVLFYVLRVGERQVLLGCINWLVSSSIWLQLSEVKQKGIVVGHTRKRWWRKYIPSVISDLIIPFQRPDLM